MQNNADLFNTLTPRQNGRHFPDDIFKCIILNENVCTSIKIALKFVPKGPINTTSALVEIMAWCWPGDKPLSETMMVSLLMHICITRPNELIYGNLLHKVLTIQIKRKKFPRRCFLSPIAYFTLMKFIEIYLVELYLLFFFVCVCGWVGGCGGVGGGG